MTIEVVRTGPHCMSAHELAALLLGLPGDPWVVLDKQGPLTEIEFEPHANEPFIILISKPGP
jgi:hypothetical protein